MQISKLEVRILMAIAIVVVGILAVVIVPRLLGSAPAAESSLAQPTPTPTPSATPAPTPTPSPTATPKTEQQILDDIVASTVSVYSVLVCNSLDEYADKTIPEIIIKVLAQYPTTGLSDASRQVMAQRVLTESTAKSCPEQSARVAVGIAG
jgi:cytoskeletal protein RodZ